jgi:hypothetical protein
MLASKVLQKFIMQLSEEYITHESMSLEVPVKK